MKDKLQARLRLLDLLGQLDFYKSHIHEFTKQIRIAFDAYCELQPCTQYVYEDPHNRTICLRCGQPYEDVEATSTVDQVEVAEESSI